ncbi:hypothetical protein FB639_001731, partial [Coemansia asiatica]
CCGYECDCMDLYYDHIMFDTRHHEMAQREAEAQAAASNNRRMTSRGSVSSMRKRSSLMSRANSSQLQQSPVVEVQAPIQPSKPTFILGAEAY